MQGGSAVIDVTITTDPNQTLTGLAVEFSWDDGPFGGATPVNIAGAQPGESFVVPFSTSAAMTDHYDWKVKVLASYAGLPNPVVSSVSGTADIVVRNVANNFYYGTGWGIAGIDQLVPVCMGVMWVTGTGDARYFAANGDGTFTGPPQETGTLTQHSDGSYTYVTPDQTVETFNAQGLEVSVVDRHGLTLSQLPVRQHEVLDERLQHRRQHYDIGL